MIEEYRFEECAELLCDVRFVIVAYPEVNNISCGISTTCLTHFVINLFERFVLERYLILTMTEHTISRMVVGHSIESTRPQVLAQNGFLRMSAFRVSNNTVPLTLYNI